MKSNIRLTDFQRDVLKAACQIPYGETRTYQWIAELIGRPKAVRAVGHVLKRNPFPVTIPSHRVIRSDGKLGPECQNSRWRKRELLQFEQERPRK